MHEPVESIPLPDNREAVRFYHPTEVAKILDASYDWVNDWVNSGALPYVELGTTSAKRRIRADDLQAFVDARTFGRRDG